MIGDKYDVSCEKCGKYLFTVEEIPYESDNGSSLGREIRVNDYMDYIYTNDGKFVCNKCAEVNMYGYVTEFCTPYRQMMPVEYEKQSDGQYHKVKMACDKVESGECDGVSCAHWKAAPEIEEKWKLRKEKM